MAAFLLGLLWAALPARALADPASQLEFSPDASPVSFGATTVNQASVRSLTVKNVSSVPASLIGMTFSGSDAGLFQPDQSFCGPTLAPTTSCSFNVRFTPTSPGSFSAQLHLHYDGASSPVTRQLSGDGVTPNLTLSPGALDFGIVSVEERDGARSVDVENAGGAPVQVNQLDIDGPDSSAFRLDFNSCQPQTLAVGQVCPVTVRFEPQERRTYNATLHARAGGSDFTAALTGVGGVGEAVLTPNPLDFGRVELNTSSTATITARSTGNVPFASVVAVLAGGDVGDLRIVRDVCSLRFLLPGETCSVTVRFTPTSVGPVRASLALVGDDQPRMAAIRGVGTAPPAKPARRRAPEVGVKFRRLRIAKVHAGRVRLGRARCRGARACTAKVGTRFAVRFRGRTYVVRGRAQSWRLRRARPVSVPLPRALHGSLSKVILTVRTRAPGHTGTVQRRVLRVKR